MSDGARRLALVDRPIAKNDLDVQLATIGEAASTSRFARSAARTP